MHIRSDSADLCFGQAGVPVRHHAEPAIDHGLGQLFLAATEQPDGVGQVWCALRDIAFAVIAVAGVLLAVRSNFDPFSGPARLIYGFEAVIIGGLGSLWGTLAGGIVIGVAQTIGAQISPAFQTLAGHLVFFAVLAIRPRGLFPRMD